MIEPGRLGALAERLGLAGLFLAGVLHWMLFLGTPGELLRGPTFTHEDWPKELHYLEVLQQAVREGRVPFYISRPIHTRKFLALPEASWSPQALFLRWIEPGPFVLLNTLILFSLGFAGCLLLKRRLGLSFPSFAFFFLLFAFNGHITAHLAVGHSMWSGYFLLPFFFLFALDLVEARSRRAPLLLAVVLFGLSLQGALHIFTWCVLLLLLLAAFDRARAGAVFEALLWAFALSACRLVPAYFLMNRKEQTFISGIPSLPDLWHALLSLRGFAEPRRGGFFGDLNWWELDTYLGPVGVGLLLVFALRRWRAGPSRPCFGLGGPLAVLAVLSLGDLYAVINVLPLPLLNAERVSSRFLVVPVLGLALVAAVEMDRWWQQPRRSLAKAGLGLALVALAASLAVHSARWRIERLRTELSPRPPSPPISIVAQPKALHGTREIAYELSVGASAAVSALALLAWGIRLRRLAQEQPAQVAGAPSGRPPSS